jgi:hypothetical protein
MYSPEKNGNIHIFSRDWVTTWHHCIIIIIIIVIGVLNLFFCTGCQVAVFWYIQFSTGVHSPIWIMCVALVTVTFCSSVVNRWPGSNWRFWSNPLLTVPDAPFIYNWHSFCPHFPRPADLDLQVFLLAWFFSFLHPVRLYRLGGKSSLFCHAVLCRVGLLIVWSVITVYSHIEAVPFTLTFMALAGICL